MRLSPHGTYFESGRTSSQFSPSPGPWYEFKIQVARETRGTRVKARVWPEGVQEPTDWMIDSLDTSSNRPIGGTFGVWTTGSGRKEFRQLRIMGESGVLLDSGRLADGQELTWSLAEMPSYLLAVNEQIPPGRFALAIAHSPDVFPSISALGWLVPATHLVNAVTWYGALSTDSALGREFAAGLFRSGPTSLYISRGIGTSRVPLRFMTPPEVTVITLQPARAQGEAA